MAAHCKGNMQPCQVFAWGVSVSWKYADISIGCGAKTKQKKRQKGCVEKSGFDYTHV